MNKLEKFYISQKTKFWSILSTIFSFILYLTILIIIKQLEKGDSSVPSFLYILHDSSLVVFTILITSILTSWLIDVKSKNEIYSEAILQDVLANPIFYKDFSFHTKQTILNTLEKDLLFSNITEPHNMYISIKEKLASISDVGYYYNSCDFHVSCSIENDIITKSINRTIRLLSYANTIEVKKLVILNWGGLKNIENHLTFEHLVINGITSHDFDFTHFEKPISMDPFCGYSISYEYFLTSPITLTSNKDTIISITYTTKTPTTDNIYVCRSGVPCKKFSVNVNLEGSPAYKLNAAAFGFLDIANNSPTCVNDHEVRVEFDDWIFSHDGVVVSFAPNFQLNQRSLEATTELN